MRPASTTYSPSSAIVRWKPVPFLLGDDPRPACRPAATCSSRLGDVLGWRRRPWRRGRGRPGRPARRRPCPSARRPKGRWSCRRASASISRCGGRGAGNRQRADACDRCRRPYARRPSGSPWSPCAAETARINAAAVGKSRGCEHGRATATFLPNFVPYRLGGDGVRTDPADLLFVPVGANSGACLRHGRAKTAPAGLPPSRAWTAPMQPQSGRAGDSRRPRLCLGPGLAGGDHEPSRQCPDARRPARAGPCSGRTRTRPPISAAMQAGAAWTGEGLERIDAESAELSYTELRKRDRPFVLPLDPERPGAGRAGRL